MKNTILDKSKLVNSVFSKVYKKYDLMNDIMSFGIHRIWKEKFIDWMNPSSNSKLIDVASGTGDIAKLFLEKTKYKSHVYCVDENKDMLRLSKKRFGQKLKPQWFCDNAENLPFKNNYFDYYTISFGIRNVDNINKALKEAHRVLKPGGRFLCLEFSKVESENLNKFYKIYSKTIPLLGKVILGKSEPYEYLIKSIEKFYNQEDFLKIINNNNFINTSCSNLSGGIVAIHSGWKI